MSKWGSSGLAYLTGLPSGRPDFSRADVLARAEQVAAAIGAHLGATVDAATLLTGRAGLLGLTRGGRISAGGGTRLLSARDGWCALTLSRPDDIAAVPALLEVERVPVDPWPVLQHWAATCLVSGITERASLLDIPAAGLGEVTQAPSRIHPTGTRAAARRLADLLVADLSSMWAGPLCGQLLARAGATVVKVESPRRPDGTRGGNRQFFDWMNGEKLSYCLDFDSQADELRELLAVADIVIEGSRPAALTRRGLGPDHIAPRAGRIWLRISGYGQDPARPAFGDDAAVAGGLVGTRRRWAGVLRRRHRGSTHGPGGDLGRGRSAGSGWRRVDPRVDGRDRRGLRGAARQVVRRPLPGATASGSAGASPGRRSGCR